MNLLGAQNTRIRFEALWCLTNLASGDPEHVQALIDKGAVELFVALLTKEDQEANIKDQAVWALGNIAGDTLAYRNKVLSCFAYLPIIKMIDSLPPDSNIVRNSTWTLTNFLRGDELPAEEIQRAIIPTLANILMITKVSAIMVDAIWGLSYASDGGIPSNIMILGVENIVPRLLELATHEQHKISLPAIRTIGNIATGPLEHIKPFIDTGLIDILKSTLGNEEHLLRKESAWTLSNLTCENVEIAGLIIQADIIGMLIYLIKSDKDQVKQESLYCISHIAMLKNSEQVFHLVEQGAIEAISSMLNKSTGADALTIYLKGLKAILEVGDEQCPVEEMGISEWYLKLEDCEGVDKLEELQTHENLDIYD